jgi:ubiquitin C-terminal hydrolase
MKNYLSDKNLDEDSSNMYELYGVINHFGIIHIGHYTCMIKSQSSGKWISYDDSSAEPISEE